MVDLIEQAKGRPYLKAVGDMIEARGLWHEYETTLILEYTKYGRWRKSWKLVAYSRPQGSSEAYFATFEEAFPHFAQLAEKHGLTLVEAKGHITGDARRWVDGKLKDAEEKEER